MRGFNKCPMSPQDFHIPFAEGVEMPVATEDAGQEADASSEDTTKGMTVSGGSISIDQLINLAIEKEASDIHFGKGRRAGLRIGGKFTFIENMAPLSEAQTKEIMS